MTAYYNENDPFVAQWLRNLIRAGLIAPGIVDERDIRDVRPDELGEFAQCHFFAGIGVWSFALRLAGWPDGRPVWTGSCPCQPFSASGRRKGFADERHLWPAWYHLLSQCRPGAVFGEQVASGDGLAWLDLVSSDLAAAGYTGWAGDICSAGFGAPHIRQRLFWLADTVCAGRPEWRAGAGNGPASGRGGAGILADAQGGGWRPGGAGKPCGDASVESGGYGPIVGLAFADGAGLQKRVGHPGISGGPLGAPARQAFGRSGLSATGRVAVADGGNPSPERQQRSGEHGCVAADPGFSGAPSDPGPVNGWWRAADWLRCRDEKWRAIEPGSFPLAHGIAGRVGRLRAYGNTINPWWAAHHIRAYLDRREIQGEDGLTDAVRRTDGGMP